jgi:hypothetical protein
MNILKDLEYCNVCQTCDIYTETVMYIAMGCLNDLGVLICGYCNEHARKIWQAQQGNTLYFDCPNRTGETTHHKVDDIYLREKNQCSAP